MLYYVWLMSGVDVFSLRLTKLAGKSLNVQSFTYVSAFIDAAAD